MIFRSRVLAAQTFWEKSKQDLWEVYSVSSNEIHDMTRNAFESDALLKTYRIVLRSLLKGEKPRVNQTGQPTRQLFVIEVLLNVVAFEAYINGMLRRYGIQLPTKMWAYFQKE